MASSRIEVQVTNVSVEQLKDELAKLCYAGYGGAMIDFKSRGSGQYSSQCTLKAFKPIDDPTA